VTVGDQRGPRARMVSTRSHPSRRTGCIKRSAHSRLASTLDVGGATQGQAQLARSTEGACPGLLQLGSAAGRPHPCAGPPLAVRLLASSRELLPNTSTRCRHAGIASLHAAASICTSRQGSMRLCHVKSRNSHDFHDLVEMGELGARTSDQGGSDGRPG